MDSTLGPLQIIIAYAVGALIVAGVAALAIFVAKRQQRAEEDVRVKASREALRKAVAAGTHDEHGQLLCVICGDKSKSETRATHHGFQIVRSEGFWSWLRQMIGAPARLRVGRRLYDDYRYCRECAHLAQHEMLTYLIAFEQQRREQMRNAEVELRRFERAGLDERVKAQVDYHEKEMKKLANRPPAQVIPFNQANGSR